MKCGYLKLEGKEIQRVFLDNDPEKIDLEQSFIVVWLDLDKEKKMLVNLSYLISLEYWENEVKQ